MKNGVDDVETTDDAPWFSDEFWGEMYVTFGALAPSVRAWANRESRDTVMQRQLQGFHEVVRDRIVTHLDTSEEWWAPSDLTDAMKHSVADALERCIGACRARAHDEVTVGDAVRVLVEAIRAVMWLSHDDQCLPRDWWLVSALANGDRAVVELMGLSFPAVSA